MKLLPSFIFSVTESQVYLQKKNPFDSEYNCAWVYSQRVKAFRATKTISGSPMEAKQIAQYTI